MRPQVIQFQRAIRDRLSSYGSVKEAAEATRRELEGFGLPFGPKSIADLVEAEEQVRLSLEKVEILRRISIIQERDVWYHGPGEGDRHWPALERYLTNTKGWGTDTVRSIDETSSEITSLLANPQSEQFRCRGLVVGYVQSGKTANMTAVIAKAVDAGYNLIVVLGGVTNKLRAQTQRRLEKDIIERHRVLWQLYTTSEGYGDFMVPANGAFTMPRERHAQLAVMKKEGSRLRAFSKTVRGTPPAILRELRVLMIDDECDQASVNSARGDYDMTRINAEIRTILSDLPAVSYVGYTATPFANVFANPFPFNRDELDDLYPRDFITALPRPENYFGALEVFGRGGTGEEDDGRDMVRVMPDGDPIRLRPTRARDKESFDPELTDELADAVLWFLATCAIRRIRGQSNEHMTMLIHSSQYVAQHRKMSELVGHWITANQSDLIAGRGEISERFDRVFKNERRRTAPEGHEHIPETLEQVREQLRGVLDALEYPVENGEADTDDRLDYENGPKTYIVVGGSVLARGLTLEGLSVSFFLRTSRQYDTLLQMGRWFGYRDGYDDLPRLWTTSDLVTKFRDLATIEEEIRDQIQLYREHNATPMEFAVKVRSIPGMAITSASKMKHVHRTNMSYDGQHVQTIRFDHLDQEIVEGNWTAASDLADAALAEGTREDTDRRILFRSVSSQTIRRFMRDTSICSEHMDLKKEFLLKYLDEMTGKLAEWNVGFVVPDGGKPSQKDLGALGKVATNRRSKLEATSGKFADVKALMSKADILIDAPEIPSDFDRARASWTEVKEMRPSIPLLLIYPIDSHSAPMRQSSKRVPLDAVGDLVGFGIVFPGSMDRSGGYFAVKLDAPTPEEIDEDELAELEADDGYTDQD